MSQPTMSPLTNLQFHLQALSPPSVLYREPFLSRFGQEKDEGAPGFGSEGRSEFDDHVEWSLETYQVEF